MQQLKLLKTGLKIIFCLLLVAWLLVRFFISPAFHMISGKSMNPILNNGDYVLTTKVEEINRYSIIVIKEKKSEELLVKRVIGIPGDTVSVSGNNVSIGNQKSGDSSFTYNFQVTHDVISQLELNNKIPQNNFFVIGDNLKYSRDSRIFGLIEESQILEQVKWKIWPIADFQRVD
ncbi:signal peptidase I [Vagococcus zengguangii]|uniref:Signal peptidase I n=1 Tax=Vagococcus zengguangii TaxID=2571750 RepID=A0A4D7CYD8_9ENTE|nr:signal peptidase I [Vagococcus zengguangii]QCI86726.1 signal peptidase I [Vagococcus zengguangii]TLG79514.1 signal peptidase I [Vagococcus zengguangii]